VSQRVRQTLRPSSRPPLGCPFPVLLVVGGIGGVLGVLGLLWSYQAVGHFSADDIFLLTAIGLGFGAVPGMLGGLALGRLSARPNRRPYQLIGALVCGALSAWLFLRWFSRLLAQGRFA